MHVPLDLRITFARRGRSKEVMGVLSMHPSLVNLFLDAENADPDHADMEICARVSSGFATLKRMSLAHIDLEEELLECLVSAPILETLGLFSLTLDSPARALVKFLRKVKSGGVLDVVDVNVDFDEHASFRSEITNIRLRQCYLNDDNVDNLVHVLSDCVNANYLDLSHNDFTSESVDLLMQMVLKNNSLRVVDLRHNNFNYLDKENIREVASAKIISILV